MSVTEQVLAKTEECSRHVMRQPEKTLGRWVVPESRRDNGTTRVGATADRESVMTTCGHVGGRQLQVVFEKTCAKLKKRKKSCFLDCEKNVKKRKRNVRIVL